MHLVNKNNIHHYFSCDQKNILEVEDDSVLVFETIDASYGQINGSKKKYDDIVVEHFVPVTGPVYIKNCMPGDALEIEILDIELSDTGSLWSRSKLGVLSIFDSIYAKGVKIDKDKKSFTFDEHLNIEYPLNPMVGCIGVAAPKSIHSSYPGNHGGNLDSVNVTMGAKVVLPVFCEGALLSMGDIHAAMGEGELCGTGIECDARVSVKIRVIKNKTIPSPRIYFKDQVSFILSGKDYDEIIPSLVHQGIEYLQEIHKIDKKDAYLLLSAIGNLKICQIVNPLKTLSLTLKLNN
ncbi:MAG TPA: hypothetical protein DHV55_01960 [Clostridiaceae bacterium]|nr:hypothetical protein [Clostridiaceae bacterium]